MGIIKREKMSGIKDKNIKKSIKIKMTAITDVGKVRKKNEDNYFIMTMKPEDVRPLGVRAVAVVADGMGGHVGGDVASGAVVRLVGGVFLTEDGWGLSKFGDNIKDAVMNLFREADTRVKSFGQGGEKPPGTTMTAAFIIGNSAYIGHVGDSRAYLIRGKTINAVTEDHSLLGELIREGKIDSANAKDFEKKNVITRAIGAGKSLKVDRPLQVELRRGDILLLCSDGLWDLVGDEEILGTIHHERWLKRGVRRLVSLANEGGGNDNITVVAIEFGRLKRDRKFADTLIGSGPASLVVQSNGLVEADIDNGKITKVIKVGAIKDIEDANDTGEITKVIKGGVVKDIDGFVDNGDTGEIANDANVVDKKSKSKLSIPVLTAIVAVGAILTILMFAGIWYGLGAVVDNFKDKEGASGVETEEVDGQKIEMEETEVNESGKEPQPIINLPDDQFD